MEPATSNPEKERKLRPPPPATLPPTESWSPPNTPTQRSMEDTRFEADRRVYNACLGAAIPRSQKVRSNPAFQLAKSPPKDKPSSKASGARSRAFQAIEDAHGFTESSMMSVAFGLSNGWVQEQVPAKEAQILGRRAFRTTKRGHPPANRLSHLNYSARRK